MEDQQQYFCSACLIPIDEDALFKRIARGAVNADQCEDCRDYGKPIKAQYTWQHPVLGKICCVPHKGEVDNDFRPLNKAGRLYMPGERICGLKDCVKRAHVIRPENSRTKTKLVADPIETLMALAEAQAYTKRENPARQQRESGRATERGSVS